LLSFARKPTEDEKSTALEFLQRVKTKLGAPAEQIDQQAWQALVRAVFRLNEFVYTD
jgi:hypothetical protein